jgi:hypothetical protein
MILRCMAGQPTRPVSEKDLNEAIDYFCKDGADIKGIGKNGENMVDYPPEGQPQFYPNDGYTMHLTMGASTVNQGETPPYKNMGWCKYVQSFPLQDQRSGCANKVRIEIMTGSLWKTIAGLRCVKATLSARMVRARNWALITLTDVFTSGHSVSISGTRSLGQGLICGSKLSRGPVDEDLTWGRSACS